MEKKPPPDTKTPANVLLELAKRKAEAQAQRRGPAFGQFTKGNKRPGDAAKPAFFGGRNGQGKP